MSDIKDYLSGLTELPEEVTIGRIVMFTITDEPVRREDVDVWFTELGLNSRFLPPPLRPVDAYKKATSEINEFEYPRADGTKGILLTRNVSTDHSLVCRFLVREVRDSSRRVLQHDKAVEMVFYKASVVNGRVKPGSERILVTPQLGNLEPYEAQHIDRAIKTMKDSYDRYANFLDGPKLRTLVRNYLGYLNAIEIKGGVYFVHRNRATELANLVELVRRFGGGCRAYQIPLVDLDNERQMVIDAFQREAEEALYDVVKEITRYRQTRQRVTPAAYAKLKQRYDTVMNQAMEYQRTLGVSQSQTAQASEVALDALGQLQYDLLNGDES